MKRTLKRKDLFDKHKGCLVVNKNPLFEYLSSVDTVVTLSGSDRLIAIANKYNRDGMGSGHN